MFWHITIARPSRHPLFLRDADVLEAVRRIARTSRGRIVFFCIADDHVHIVVFGTREDAGRCVMAIKLALNPLGAGLGQPFYRAVTSRHHLASLVRYVLDQTTHHEIHGAHPALWPGSSFWDLIGARRLGFDADLLFRSLPRLSTDHVFEAVGLPPLLPVADADASELPAAIAAASASPATSRRAHAARTAALQLSSASTGELVQSGFAARTVQRARTRPPDPAWLRAVGLQVALRRQLSD